ncbi:hypothetical protein L226DRAFT_568686 [Lentinus tigrinus ALCF2SS1-7]|uniref:uncharacterized protein n=1 Tax=Lentinus tigrinus ALCF2SS1-7 TaxID=1328758 RepID=UPI001165F873|nr:hypothetical protein L226DRAFT_568686 [Lentinus tigrinus ALCF2SS1-7]
MPTHYSRDTHTQPLLASHQCRPISPSFRFCAGDITALVVAAVSIWYIVWGIPLTIRCYKLLSAILAARKLRRLGLAGDVEKTGSEDQGKNVDVDPRLSLVSHLPTHLDSCEDVAVPPPVYTFSANPNPTETSHSKKSSAERQSSSGTASRSLSRSSLSGIYSPRSRRSGGVNPAFAASKPSAVEPSIDVDKYDILSTLPSRPPLAYLGHADSRAD